MISKIDKNADRVQRHARVRKKIAGTAETPRFNVYRSLNHIYVQVIDDVKGVTLVSASTMEKAVKEKIQNLTKTEAAKVVGAEAAKKALAAGIETVVFDRGEENDGFIKKLIQVNRVTKVVKGGRNMRFAALVVVGDGKGRVGVGSGKANEVPEAIEKATAQAKRNLITVPMLGTTIPHEVYGKFGRGYVYMMPAAEGTGVIAGGPVRAVMEAAGVKDIRTKSHGTSNPINCVKATIAGLADLKTAEQLAAARGKTVEEIVG